MIDKVQEAGRGRVARERRSQRRHLRRATAATTARMKTKAGAASADYGRAAQLFREAHKLDPSAGLDKAAAYAAKRKEQADLVRRMADEGDAGTHLARTTGHRPDEGARRAGGEDRRPRDRERPAVGAEAAVEPRGAHHGCRRSRPTSCARSRSRSSDSSSSTGIHGLPRGAGVQPLPSRVGARASSHRHSSVVRWQQQPVWRGGRGWDAQSIACAAHAPVGDGRPGCSERDGDRTVEAPAAAAALRNAQHEALIDQLDKARALANSGQARPGDRGRTSTCAASSGEDTTTGGAGADRSRSRIEPQGGGLPPAGAARRVHQVLQGSCPRVRDRRRRARWWTTSCSSPSCARRKRPTACSQDRRQFVKDIRDKGSANVLLTPDKDRLLTEAEVKDASGHLKELGASAEYVKLYGLALPLAKTMDRFLADDKQLPRRQVRDGQRHRRTGEVERHAGRRALAGAAPARSAQAALAVAPERAQGGVMSDSGLAVGGAARRAAPCSGRATTRPGRARVRRSPPTGSRARRAARSRRRRRATRATEAFEPYLSLLRLFGRLNRGLSDLLYRRSYEELPPLLGSDFGDWAVGSLARETYLDLRMAGSAFYNGLDLQAMCLLRQMAGTRVARARSSPANPRWPTSGGRRSSRAPRAASARSSRSGCGSATSDPRRCCATSPRSRRASTEPRARRRETLKREIIGRKSAIYSLLSGTAHGGTELVYASVVRGNGTRAARGPVRPPRPADRPRPRNSSAAALYLQQALLALLPARRASPAASANSRCRRRRPRAGLVMTACAVERLLETHYSGYIAP